MTPTPAAPTWTDDEVMKQIEEAFDRGIAAAEATIDMQKHDATIRNRVLDDVAKLILKEAGIEKQRPFNPDTDRIPEIGIDVMGEIIQSLRTPSTQDQHPERGDL